MTHSPPSHLEWTRSAGNRPETQPPRGPETWWCLPACLPAKQILPLLRDKTPPTMSQSYKANMIEACYPPSYDADTISERSVHTLQHTSVSWCAVHWCVITPWMARSPSSDFSVRVCVQLPTKHYTRCTTQSSSTHREGNFCQGSICSVTKQDK